MSSGICGFCHTQVPEDDFLIIQVVLPPPGDESAVPEQHFYAHRSCLRRALHPEIPLLVTRGESAEEQE